MTNNSFSMGIDLGSTTAKVVILNKNEAVFSAYRRHQTEIRATLQAILREARQSLGDIPLQLRLTGSAGLGVSEKFKLPFIQEVVASAEVVRQRYPTVKTLIDIGGEDAKIIFFNAGGQPDIRMNGACAGGTGAFIDQMATLLDIPVTELNALAEKQTTLYPIASRCGVFAKTDVQNLLSREVPRADIAASVFQAVVLQTLATLARGCQPAPAVLFSGGPLTFLPALRTAFMRALAVEPGQVAGADHPELLPALGAALADKAQSAKMSLNQLLTLLADESPQSQFEPNRLAPLFKRAAELDEWTTTQNRRQAERVDLSQVAREDCFLGVDSGSTTTKLVLIDPQGRFVFSHYGNNNGNPIGAVQAGLNKLRQLLAGQTQPPRIGRSAVTGYGEELIRAAFGFDQGIVETLAHFQAARAFNPQVSFILDIGGQDMKAIFVQNGHIQNIEINEACSSGCGSFIESFARSLGYTVSDFAQTACLAQAPCDLGSRCTVFMNSRVKQALREGATVGEISAGLAYSVIKNALYKVLKITNTAKLGEHIVVQGGTFRNPAVQRALELLLGRPVLRPDIAELMGAYGAALTARDAYTPQYKSDFVGLAQLAGAEQYTRQTIRCRGCENTCAITKLLFLNKNAFYTGNRCERIFTNSGQKTRTGINLPARKYQLLFDRPTTPDSPPRLTIGLPRVLNLYENFPFWSALLVECGFKVHLSDVSTHALYQQGVATVMSENICFPAKLAHGHIYNLIEAGVDRILYPLVTFEKNEFADADNCYNCPIVTGYPEVVRSAINPAGQFGIPLDMPALTFADEKLLKKSCGHYLQSLGVNSQTFNRAFKRAIAAQQQFKANVRALGAQILSQARVEKRAVVLLIGRPYHLDHLVNHKIPDILADFGLDILTEDAIPLENKPTLNNRHVITMWQYPNRYYYAARWAGQQPDVEVVQLNSFGCGPDAIAVDEVKAILAEHGKSPTVIRIDEIDSPGSAKLRLRSMFESLRQTDAGLTFTPRLTTRPFQRADSDKTILVPQFSHFYTAPLVRPLQDMGYRLNVLPPADRESVQLGLKYANNEICYPATILVGDVIKGLQSGQYDPAQVAVGITQTGGHCRDSCYLSLFKKALTAAGFAEVPVVAIGLRPINEQPGFKVNMLQYARGLLLSVVYADALSAMYHACAVRERQPGQALQLANKYMQRIESGDMLLTQQAILNTLTQAVTEFNHLAVYERTYPKVGLVGEIYVKYNSFGNNQMVQWLMNQGLEVVFPSLLEFFLAMFVIWDINMERHLTQQDLLLKFVSLAAQTYIRPFTHQTEAVLREFRYYRPHHPIADIARTAEEIVTLTNSYGEGWLIPGEIGQFVKHDVPNVLCLQPFGCLANHIVAKGIEKRLRAHYPQLNLLFLDADAGVSEVNFFNRTHFFVNHAKTVASHHAAPAVLAEAEPGKNRVLQTHFAYKSSAPEG